MDDVVKTKLRRRYLLAGSCLLNNTSAVSAVKGDGAMARTDVGTFTVTLDRKYPDFDSLIAYVNAGTGDQKVGATTYSNSGATTVITITTTDISGAATADLNAVRLNWIGVASGRGP